MDSSGEISDSFLKAVGYLLRLHPLSQSHLEHGPFIRERPVYVPGTFTPFEKYGLEAAIRLMYEYDTKADGWASGDRVTYRFVINTFSTSSDIFGLLLCEAEILGQFRRVGVVYGTRRSGSDLIGAVFRYQPSVGVDGERFATDEQWLELGQKEASWVTTIGDSVAEGPELLYHNHPEVVEGWDRFESQTITII